MLFIQVNIHTKTNNNCRFTCTQILIILQNGVMASEKAQGTDELGTPSPVNELLLSVQVRLGLLCYWQLSCCNLNFDPRDLRAV